jgi:anti-sigma B factor antagonist
LDTLANNANHRRPFDLEVERRGETAIVRLRGEFDLGCEKEFKDQMRLVATDGLRELVFDLRELTFIDSTGLRMILEHWNHSHRDGFDLSILPGSGQVQRVFAITGLNEVLPIHDSASRP